MTLTFLPVAEPHTWARAADRPLAVRCADVLPAIRAGRIVKGRLREIAAMPAATVDGLTAKLRVLRAHYACRRGDPDEQALVFSLLSDILRGRLQ